MPSVDQVDRPATDQAPRPVALDQWSECSPRLRRAV